MSDKIRVSRLPIIIIISILLLSGCVTENDLFKPLSKYLSKQYGINENFHFLTWDNNWFEGIDHQTAIEINSPYHTTAFITLVRDSYNINEENSDNVYFELFKGAYIEQHPEVISISNQIIKKYNLMKKSPIEYDVAKGNFYYYLNVSIDKQQEDDQVEKFKQSQSIDTIKLLSNLKITTDTESKGYRGVINFSYYFNTYKQSKTVPRAEDILKDFEKSHVLTEGLYCIAVRTIDAGPDSISYGIDPRNSNVRFRVDSNGVFRDIDVLPPEE